MLSGTAWHKSTYSGYNGNCVEVRWNKSSHSHGNGNCVEVRWGKSSHSLANGNCVETATGCGEIHVRDSKHPDGPALTFSPQAWAAFTAGVKAGKFAIA